MTTRPETAFDGLVLRQSTSYRFWILSARTLKIGRVEASSGPLGAPFRVPRITFHNRPAFDKDEDRLADLSENLFGTEAATPGARTGILASTPRPGRAVDFSRTLRLRHV